MRPQFDAMFSRNRAVPDLAREVRSMGVALRAVYAPPPDGLFANELLASMDAISYAGPAPGRA